MLSRLNKNKSLILKIFGGTVLTGAGLLYYGILKTVEHISYAVNTKVLELERKTVSYIYIDDPEVKELLKLQFLGRHGIFEPNSLTSAIFIWWKNVKLTYALKLMAIAKCQDCRSRLKAIDNLTNYCNFLKASDWAQLAQRCDAKTAIALARSKNADSRLFHRRLPHKSVDKQVLITKIRDMLVALNKKKEHECLTYFLLKTFPGFHNEQGTFFDIDIRGKVRPPQFYNEDILLKCIKELSHYCSIVDNSEDIINLGGLELIRQIYTHLGDEYSIEFAKILEPISLLSSSLNHIHITGWVEVLAGWLKHTDKRLSTRAAHTLANLDSDDLFNASYGPRVLLLHPLYRRFLSKNCVDVVFIHGLLGGALVTWRQRDVKVYQITFFDLQSPQTTSEPPQKKRIMDTSDLATKEYIKTIQDLKEEEWEKLGDDFEFVLCDFPTKVNNFKGSLSVPGSNTLVKKCLEEEGKTEFTSCWPQDWLAKDCPNIRVLCVNYDTRLTDWQFSCLKGTKRDIESLSDSLLDELVESGVGQRPVVWVVHSMGGLIVKSMIVKAWQRRDKKFQEFHQNTKGIIFLSTPHFGSHIATMFDSHRSILWPSNEVDDLRVDSVYLKKLHQQFLKWVKEVPQTIVTIAETKPTQLSGLGLWVEFLFVSPESADPGLGDLYFLPYDHVNICKPSNRLSFIYKKVLEVVQEAMALSE